MAACGATTITEMEAALEVRPRHGFRIASGLWSRYLRGDVAPRGALTGAKDTLVDQVGAIWPQTALVFNFPVWNLLRWDGVIDLDRTRGYYLALNEAVRRPFYLEGAETSDPSANRGVMFWHLQKSPDVLTAAIKALHKDLWSMLVMALLEARMGYAAQRQDRFFTAQMLASEAVRAMGQHPGFQRARVQGGLVVMEALCLEPLRRFGTRSTTSDGAQKMQSDFNRRLEGWMRRYDEARRAWTTTQRREVRRMLGQTAAGAYARWPG